jgi:hypothetical protein
MTAQTPSCASAGAHIDRNDVGVRMRRADDMGVQGADRHRQIVGIAAAADKRAGSSAGAFLPGVRPLLKPLARLNAETAPGRRLRKWTGAPGPAPSGVHIAKAPLERAALKIPSAPAA